MDDYKDLLKVGMEKGEWDFSVRATIENLSDEQMMQFRSMVVVAIGTMEYMWRRAEINRHENTSTNPQNK